MYVYPAVDVAKPVAKWRLSRWLCGSGGQWMASKSWHIFLYYLSVLIDTCHKHLPVTLKHYLALKCYQLCTLIFILPQCAAPHLSCVCPNVGCYKWYPKSDLGLTNKWKPSKDPNQTIPQVQFPNYINFPMQCSLKQNESVQGIGASRGDGLCWRGLSKEASKIIEGLSSYEVQTGAVTWWGRLLAWLLPFNLPSCAAWNSMRPCWKICGLPTVLKLALF